MDSNANTSPDPEAAARRRSGRVVRVPDKFAPEASQAAAKRKRDNGEDEDGDDAGADDDENDVPDLDDGISDDDDDDDHESDEEPARPKRAKKPSQSQRARKPSAKKPKINGTQPDVGAKTVTLPRMPKKSVRLDTTGAGTGLYGMGTMLRLPNWRVMYMAMDY